MIFVAADGAVYFYGDAANELRDLFWIRHLFVKQ